VPRRAILIGFGLAVSVAVIATAAATTRAREAPSRSQARVVFQFYCAGAGRTLRYVFWPKGHSGRGTPSEFPERTYTRPPQESDAVPPDPNLPHVNVYRGSGSYADRNWLLFISGTPPGSRGVGGEGGLGLASVGYHSFSRPCFGPLPGDKYDGALRNVATSTEATALRCRFTSRWGYTGLSIVQNSSLRRGVAVYQRNARDQRTRSGLFTATLDTTRPKLRWNTSFCRRIPLPR
jgi:hypothetical protein